MTDIQGSSTERSPKSRRSRRGSILARTIIAASTAVVLALMGGVAIGTWPHPAPAGHAADIPLTGYPQPDWGWRPAGTHSSTDVAWANMNKAMRKHDRAGFLKYATGQARAQLALWWDNTTKIGWSTAYILPEVDGGKVSGVFLGAELAFDAHSDRGTGGNDAGLRLTQGFQYKSKATGSGDSVRISSITPVKAMPWDDGPIYVVKQPHVVLYGLESERALVDANAATAEQGAELALSAVKNMGGNVPMNGFVSGITDSQDNFYRWMFGPSGKQFDMDVAGYAAPALRPEFPSSLLAPDVATGAATGGSLELLGPLSASSRLSTFTHEFAHALLYAALPEDVSLPTARAVQEGFATYVQYVSHVFPGNTLLSAQAQASIAANGSDAFSDARLTSADAWTAYEAAGSYYEFIAAEGGSPWQLALDGQEGSLLGLDGRNLNKAWSPSAWQAWAARQ